MAYCQYEPMPSHLMGFDFSHMSTGLQKLPVHVASGEGAGGGHGSEENVHQDTEQPLQ